MSVDHEPAVDEQEPAAPPLPPATTELAFSAGQSAWLAVVTVGVLVAIGLSIAALVVASGSDGGGGAAAPTGPSTALDIEAREFSFAPADVAIAADTDVPVTLDNIGAVEHNWAVLEAGTTISSESDFDESTVVFQVDADPGTSDSGTVNLAAGSYQVICTVPGHLSAGMEGSLEVTG
jgi:uncharacterized cupredoxin-like copper-binding protein